MNEQTIIWKTVANMADDDIEEFLKRAAQRRQAKTSQAAAAAPPPPPKRPEYTDSRSERMPRNESNNRRDDVPVQAILVDEVEANPGRVAEVVRGNQNRSPARQRVPREKKRRNPDDNPVQKIPVAEIVMPVAAPPPVQTAYTIDDGTGTNVADRLMTMMRKPDGLMQAILLKEILTRPEHRW